MMAVSAAQQQDRIVRVPMPLPKKPQEVVYPESDGKPMGETGFHVMAILRLCSALRYVFQHNPNVYVAADMFWYYEEGNPKANKAPDVMVIKGVNNQERRTFKSWEERAVPAVIIEVTSRTTITEDLFNKGALYARLGVREYFLFDPLEEYLRPSLIGFILSDNTYIPLELNEDRSLFSQELGFVLRPEGHALRLVDPQTGQVIPELEEAIVSLMEAEHRAEQERQRAEAAEAELTRLRALIEAQPETIA